MLNMLIKDWKNRIDKQFEAGLWVDGISGTYELTNFEYSILPVLDSLVEAPNREEIIERNFVIERSKLVANYLLDDMNSRRASFVNNYDGEDNHCISYFHHYIRDNSHPSHCMNVYVRSMNYDTNFVFDNQTFCLAYWAIHNLLTLKYVLEPTTYSYIRVFVFSLHKFKENQ